MRILITNDDSVSAAQLIPLIRWCQKIGDVTVVVPKYEQSGKSHGIELHKPFEGVQRELEPGLTVWTVDSTPADCVRFAVFGLKQTFDLVISGINRGYNMGSDMMYSGTVGAACEAGELGFKALAISTGIPSYAEAITHMDRVWDYICQNRLLELGDLYNINIPSNPIGVRITRQGGPYYSDDFIPLENGLWSPKGKRVHQDRGDLNIDSDAVTRGYISVMPLTTSKVHEALYEKLISLNA